MFSSSFQWNYELKHVLDLITSWIVRDLHENDFANSLGLDFERTIYVGEFSNDEGMEDDDLPPAKTLLASIWTPPACVTPNHNLKKALPGNDVKILIHPKKYIYLTLHLERSVVKYSRSKG